MCDNAELIYTEKLKARELRTRKNESPIDITQENVVRQMVSAHLGRAYPLISYLSKIKRYIAGDDYPALYLSPILSSSSYATTPLTNRVFVATMVLKSQGAESARLERQIGCIKYTIFCFNAIIWILGGGMFGLSVWLRMEPGFVEWVDFLDISEFYDGIYILIAASIIVMVIAFVGCAAALMEHVMALYVHIGLEALCFVLGLAGSAVLLDYSTYDSQIQPIIKRSMTALISNSQHEGAAEILRIVQENMGCCGAEGPMDYLNLLKPLPTECRDTVTGNAFFHGCVEEFTWFLEARSGWLAGVSLSLCMLHVIVGVLSLVLVQAKQKEEEAVIFKR